MTRPTRRLFLGAAGATTLTGWTAGNLQAAPQPAPAASPASPIRYCLNTSTIRGQELGLAREVEIASTAGYDAIEPWIREIQQYQQEGGDLADLRKRIEDAGLRVESAIGFANWIGDDDEQRAQGLEQAKREMDLVLQLGGRQIAALPAGATRTSGMNLLTVAERYGALIRAGREIGVVPLLELWGFSQTLSRLGELAFVAVESGEPEAALLPDVYHIYKGGSDFSGLALINAARIPLFHMNDYPAEPKREEIGDAQRVYPGDGVAPLTEILRTLGAGGFAGTLSLELFNPEYWKQDPAAVAKTGLEKMRQAVAASEQG